MQRRVSLSSFALKFSAFFIILFTLFELARGSSFEKFLIEDIALEPTAALVNTLAPHEALSVQGRNLVSAGSTLHVTRGCEGVEMLLLLVAGIVAFPATARHRLRGLLTGLAMIYVLTLGRLIALHFTLRYSPEAWDLLHGLVLPLGPVLVVALYFLHWSGSGAYVERTNRLLRAN